MAQKKLDEAQIAERDGLLLEYRALAAKLDFLQSVLNKIEENSKDLKVEIKSNLKSVESAIVKSYRGSSPGKEGPGRPSKWGNFILHKLKSLDRPLTYEEIIGEAVVAFGNAASKDPDGPAKSVFSTVYRLRQSGLLGTEKIPGKTHKYIALKSWFTPGGKLKKEYVDRVLKSK